MEPKQPALSHPPPALSTPSAKDRKLISFNTVSYSSSNNSSSELPKVKKRYSTISQCIVELNEQPIKQGFIKKYTNMVHGFQNRYFALTKDLLVYFKYDTTGVSEKGKLSLKIIQLDYKTSKDLNMVINTGVTAIHLKFCSIEDKNLWYKAIIEQQSKLKDSQHNSHEKNKGESNFKQSPVTIKRSKSKEQEGGFDKEIKEALSMALQINIIKEDSLLSKFLAETWLAQSQFESEIRAFRGEVERRDDQELLKLSTKVESTSNELKQSVTNAVKQLDLTKIQILKLLEKQDQILKQNNQLLYDEEEQEVSLAEDFNEMVEGRRDVYSDPPNKQDASVEDFPSQEVEELKSSEGGGRQNWSSHLEDPNDDGDDFFDAEDNDENIAIFQKDIVRNEEFQEFDSDSEEERTTLPALKPPDQKVSIWKVIKEAIGKDLSRFCVPVYFNEPLSMVQKISEIMEYHYLLDKACNEEDPYKRMLYVASFGIAQYKCTENRTNKPFNPLLGETFELKHRNYKFFSEQVSHHPPISALHAFNENYEFWMNTNMKTAFWGKSLEVKPLGYQNIVLKNRGERYTLNRPVSTVNNLIFGVMYIEHVGVMSVKNWKTGDICEVEFKKRGWNNKNAFELEGYAMTADREKKYYLSGKWNERITVRNYETGAEETIWQASALPEMSDHMYYFTKFALQLNHLPSHLKDKLPPTDSRFRPDQRALEQGDLRLAADEKHRLEEKQRSARKFREQNKIEYRPKYFEPYRDELTGEEGFRYARDYWKDREQGTWPEFEELF